MEGMDSTMFVLIVAWSIVTVALIIVWIYRSTLTNREEDQIFLDAAQESMAREQRAIVARIEKLSKPIMSLVVLSSTLLLVIAGIWLWQGFKNF
jgi:hypothetical protein